jgi:hypothetical protein
MEFVAFLLIFLETLSKIRKKKRKNGVADQNRRAAGAAPNPNGQGGGHIRFLVRGLTQMDQIGHDLCPGCTDTSQKYL